MGILDSFLRRKQEPADTLPIPSATGESLPTAARRQGTAILNRAGQIYRDNPKKVQALGLVAAAVLLTRMKRGRV
jgi:hypothetical protein